MRSRRKRILSALTMEGMWSPGEMVNCPATIPRSLTPEEVPLHIVDALQEDLDPRHAPRFPVSVQNRFDALDSTARDSSGLRPTSVEGSGVDIFPKPRPSQGQAKAKARPQAKAQPRPT